MKRVFACKPHGFAFKNFVSFLFSDADIDSKRVKLVFDEYFKHKNLKNSTKKSYCNIFFKLKSLKIDWHTCTEQALVSILMEQADWNQTTFLARMRIVKGILNFGISRNLLPETLRITGSYSAIKKPIECEISLESAKRFLSASVPSMSQDRTLACKLLFATGLRRSELLSLVKSDCVIDSSLVFLNLRNGKGGLGRKVVVLDQVQKELIEKIYSTPTNSEKIFKFSESTLYRDCKKLTQRIFGKEYSPRMLRRFFAHYLRAIDVGLEGRSQALGHKSVETTRQMYDGDYFYQVASEIKHKNTSIIEQSYAKSA